VIDVAHFEKNAIQRAVKKQLAHGPYPSSEVYYKPNTSERIVEILNSAPLYVQKKFFAYEV
jgi:hypothetical protein